MTQQVNLLQEIIVDGFCGGGGWSTGIELATGRPVDVGINHDAAAIALHKKNHPFTRHYQTNIFEVDPVEACAGRRVGWAHFSPDCKHFSRAKGAKPVNKQIRSLAWVVVQWAAKVKPRIISMENVPEFLTWGPCIALRGPHGRVMKQVTVVDERGKETVKLVEAEKGENVPKHLRALTPDPRRKGKTFQQFVGHLEALGYKVEWNELIASDFGAPTSRRRFFLLARRDSKPIVWPEPTHGDPKSLPVQTGKRLPWRTAAEVIDWSLPCPSIFERKKPLAENTLKRIAKGLQKFVIDNPEPFIVQINHSGEAFRGQPLNEPMPTVTAKHGFGVVTPIVTKFQQNSVGQSPEEPLDTVMPGATRFGVVAPTMIQYHTEQSPREHRGQALEAPLQTVDAANRYGLVGATLVQTGYGERSGQQPRALDPQKPPGTVVGSGKHALAAATLLQFNNHCDCRDLREPMPTITAQSNHFAEVRAMLIKYYSGEGCQPVDKPLDTITTRDRFGLVTVQGVDYQIVDIGLRMLTPRELYSAQGFPEDYEIETDCYGNAYPKKEQVARCGNAVPPPFAIALVRANAPEWCEQRFETMKELEEVWAV